MQYDNKGLKSDPILQEDKLEILFLAYIFKHVSLGFFFNCLACTQLYKEMDNLPVRYHREKI